MSNKKSNNRYEFRDYINKGDMIKVVRKLRFADEWEIKTIPAPSFIYRSPLQTKELDYNIKDKIGIVLKKTSLGCEVYIIELKLVFFVYMYEIGFV